VIGTLNNNILNVPLRDITKDFHASVSAGVLVVSSFVLVLAAGMALTGWIGDRFGRSRTLSVALVVTVVTQLVAAAAPSLGVLVAVRALQGLACSAIPPSVMGMLAEIYPAGRRSRVMGAWAAANGAGQALGPPLGGLLAQLWGWRSIFLVLAPLTALVALAGRRLPRDRGVVSRLHWTGATSLTLGATLVMTAVTVVPQREVPVPLDLVLGAAGLAFLALFVLVSRAATHPLIEPRLLIEARFLRSAVASFAQMLVLLTVLVAVPLYITGTLDRSTATTGILVFALPATMAVLAPVVGALSDRVGPRIVMRWGLVVLAGSCLALGWFTSAGTRSVSGLCGMLVGVGVGVAMVQTPSAAGATRSPAGRTGTALGLFNMMRFGGSAFGAAWVAVIYPRNELLLLFAGAAALSLAALLTSFLGSDPVPAPARPAERAVSA
jgi:MFS family permease